jgi:hypothetical protein
LKRALIFLALSGAILLTACGGNGDTTSQSTFNNGSGNQPYKPTTHLSHRALITNYYAGDMAVMDATQNRLTSYTFSTGSLPTYMQSSPDGTLTLVNNTGSNSLSSFNNNTESVKASVSLGGYTESFVTSKSNKLGFAAVPNYSNGTYRTPGAIVRFNPTDGSLNTQIQFPDVRYLGMDPQEGHLIAFTSSAIVENKTAVYPAYWVDLTSLDPNTEVPPYYQLALEDSNGNAVTLDRPVAVFFSSDNTKAFILSCGPECGGTVAPSVTEVDTTSITTPSPASTGAVLTATVLHVWSVKGAQVGFFNSSTNILYLAGSTGATSVDSGGKTVNDGYFTGVDVTNTSSSYTPSTIKIGNGTNRIIRSIGKTFWVGARNCGVQSCVTIVKADMSAQSQLATAQGDATGISLQKNSGDVYTIEGGYFYMYDQSGNTVTSEYNTDIKGQTVDVIYID